MPNHRTIFYINIILLSGNKMFSKVLKEGFETTNALLLLFVQLTLYSWYVYKLVFSTASSLNKSKWFEYKLDVYGLYSTGVHSNSYCVIKPVLLIVKYIFVVFFSDFYNLLLNVSFFGTWLVSFVYFT